MKKELKTTLITGLWEHSNHNGKYMIGRIGSNLYAVVIPYKEKKDKQPDYMLFFVNGSKDDISNFVSKKFEEINF
jgi:hypothetical protein